MVVAEEELRVTKAGVEAVVVRRCAAKAEVATGCATRAVAEIECGAAEIKLAVKECAIMMVVGETTTDAGTGAAAFGSTTTMMSDMVAAIAIAGATFAQIVGVGVVPVSAGA